MLLLVIDTSGRNGSLGLARAAGSAPQIEIIEEVPLTGGTFSAQLVPQISALLSKHGFNKNDLSGLVVVSGPGSFTGLRVGLAAVKALAEVLQQPVAAVSRLEAVARSGATRGVVLAALDAGRGEVYAGDYELDDADRPATAKSRERLLRLEELLSEAKGKTVITPDSAPAKALGAGGAVCQLISHPGSDIVARIGWERIQRGQVVRPEDLDANYIRRSDAEIFSPPKP